MPQILPFRGIRYTPAAGPLSDVLAPPYDVISPAQQTALEARSPYNAVRLELASGGQERYSRVAGLIASWESAGATKRDDIPMLYVYEQEFVEEGRRYTRRALIAEVEAQPWEDGAIKPHEHTMSGPKEDRLKLLEATDVQLSPVFMIARDRAGQLTQFLEATIASRPPDVSGTSIDGDTHRLWVVEASRYEMRSIAPLLSESFYIADGHHRYETAVNYKLRTLDREGALPRDHPARFAMTAIVAASDPGLVIRPIHRVVPRPAPADWRERLAPNFSVEPLADSSPATLAAALASHRDAIVALGLDAGAACVLKPLDGDVFARLAPSGHSAEWAEVGPNLARYGILAPLWGITDDDLRAGAVEYSHDLDEVLDRAHDGACCLLLRPVSVEAVISLADKGERLPQKSTFFHPKLGTGLVFHPLKP
ncbi:MAG: DUF1015 family protein [Dehalococcoidia bacterium]